jgi:hypothetical protein
MGAMYSPETSDRLRNTMHCNIFNDILQNTAVFYGDVKIHDALDDAPLEKF